MTANLEDMHGSSLLLAFSAVIVVLVLLRFVTFPVCLVCVWFQGR